MMNVDSGLGIEKAFSGVSIELINIGLLALLAFLQAFIRALVAKCRKELAVALKPITKRRIKAFHCVVVLTYICPSVQCVYHSKRSTILQGGTSPKLPMFFV